MQLVSLNPATGEVIAQYQPWNDSQLQRELAAAAAGRAAWRDAAIGWRTNCFRRIATALRAEAERHSRLVTAEMGKPIRESRAEIEKCARVCEFYAENAEPWLRDQMLATEARRSLVVFQPLGTVLAIMPWNFPFWQVFRAAVPALAAGNSILLKHADNVSGCASALESLCREAGVPAGVVRWLPISHEQAEQLIASPEVQAVTLTGSERAGRRIAALAGAALKKTVLELGGSDPFVVLADADVDLAVETAVTARFQNCGQSCIAAKRFILVNTIADDFMEEFRAQVDALTVGDPMNEDTRIGPLARSDLRATLQRQVEESIRLGAVPLVGCQPLEGPGFFYAPSILEQVRPGCPAHDEEMFGPVAAIVRVGDEAEALVAANCHALGLGGSVWTRDIARGERFVRALASGLGFVNGMVRSDPRLPFGGIRSSGYGRELGALGLHEFTNIKTLWID